MAFRLEARNDFTKPSLRRVLHCWYLFSKDKHMDDIHTTQQALAVLLDGGVGVMPTDTLYGLVARASFPQAVTRLYTLKQREHKPGTVIAADVNQLIALGLYEQDVRAVEHFW